MQSDMNVLFASFFDTQDAFKNAFEKFAKPTFSKQAGRKVTVTFDPWVICSNNGPSGLSLRAADGTEFKLAPESRIAINKDTYTLGEFIDYYGFEEGVRQWNSSDSLDHVAKPTFETRNDAAMTSFGHASVASDVVQTSHVLYSVAPLSNLEYVKAPPFPTEQHAARLQECIHKGRHSDYFNKWMTPADLDSTTMCFSVDDQTVYSFHQKLQTLNIPISNEITSDTKHLSRKKQVYRLWKQLEHMCEIGGLCVSYSTGLSAASSYLQFSCRCCNASLHIATPYLLSGGVSDPKLVEAIDRHFGNFLYGPESKRPLCMCTAEMAFPGSKQHSEPRIG